MEILFDYRTVEPCVCEGEWLKCVKEILHLNNIDEKQYANALYSQLLEGRGKFKNIMLVGVFNCGKTFLVKPLRTLYQHSLFENPANTKFGWVGVEKTSVILLQDFRWERELICWNDLLLLLEEDETVKFPTPRNTHREDIVIPNTSKVAIFATSKTKIFYPNPDDKKEQDMMDSRWKIFKFTHALPRMSERKSNRVKIALRLSSCEADFRTV